MAYPKALMMMVVLGISLLAKTPMAAEPVMAEIANNQSPIHITADRLEVFHAESRAMFIGNVKATQGTTVLTADQLSVHYRSTSNASSDSGDSTDAAPPVSAIEQIISSGSVVIRFDNKVAEGAKAIYNTASGILELTGTPCRVTSDGNVVTGSKITVYRSEDRVSVEGESADRVKAIIFTQDGQLAPQGANGQDR